jgi:hypothetical protein
MFRGRGLKNKAKRFLVRLIKATDVFLLMHNTPFKATYINSQIEKNKTIELYSIYKKHERTELEPNIWNYKITKRFSELYRRFCSEAFVSVIPSGKVTGESSNWIIFEDGTLSIELSREFGAFGGINPSKGKLINEQLNIVANRHIKGNVAVITTCGFNNFHHWNYDCIPRIHLLLKVFPIEKIDFFVIQNYSLPFQKESLDKLNIPREKILKLNESELISADNLLVPSLPSILGTVSPWVVDFLRALYLDELDINIYSRRIYISRKNVSSRKVINNERFQTLLSKFGFLEIFPEDYSVSEMARIIKRAEIIVSIHGSGLSNICFISPDTIVIDILAPYHQDGYYWQITNICNGKYFGFFSEGEHPKEDLDLVRAKSDYDLIIDVEEFYNLLKYVISQK